MVRKKDSKATTKSGANEEKQPVRTRKRVVRPPKAEKIAPVPVEIIPPVNQFAAVLNSVRAGICIFTNDNQVEYINEAFSQITGLSESAVGKKLKKNALWVSEGQQDEFQELMARARESGSPLIMNSHPVSLNGKDEKYWNITLLPKRDKDGEYAGMGLIIEDATDQTPRVSNAELLNRFCEAAISHSEMQALLNDVVHMLKDFSRCSSVKILLTDTVADTVLRAETGLGPGLWDMDLQFTAASFDGIFVGSGDESDHRTKGGSIYLEDIVRTENKLNGELKELVTNVSNSYGLRSIALIPVRLEGRLNGFIQLGNKKNGGIPCGVIETVENISQQLKLAFERVILKDELQKERESLLKQMNERGAHLVALSERLKREVSERKRSQDEMCLERDLAIGLSGRDDLEDALKLCLDTVIRMPGVDSGWIHIFEKESGELVLIGHKGLSSAFIESMSRCTPSSANIELVMSRLPVYINLKDAPPPLDEGYKVDGLMGAGIVPIAYDDTVIATLNVASHQLVEIPVDIRNSLEVVASEMGSAIARLINRAELREIEGKYSRLFSETASPVMVIDMDGKYLEANEAALEFLECSRDELLTMHVKDTLPSYLDEQWLDQYMGIWQSGGAVERDYYVWGKIKVMDMTVTPLQLGKDRVVVEIGKDITERKKAETALRESEEKFRQYFEDISDVIYFLDRECKIADMSPSVESLLGYKAAELVGRPLDELNLFTVESLSVARGNISRALAGETVQTSEYQCIAKDGSIKFTEISNAPLCHNGEIVGVVSVARNVSERKMAEEALRKTREKYRLLAENVVDMVYLMDMNCNITWATPSAERASGFTLDEMKSLPAERRLTPESLQKTADLLARALDEDKSDLADPQRVYTENLELYRNDGSTFWSESKFRLVRDENGRAIALLAEGRDITERRKNEESLQSSAEKFKEMADLLPQVIFELDDKGIFTYVNKYGVEVFGYTADEMIGKLNIVDVITPEDRDRALANYVGTGTGEKNTVGEYGGVKKDSSVFNMLIFSDIIVHNGKAVGLRGSLTDITSLKEAQNALRESEEKYRSIVENAGEGILVLQDGKFKYANDRLISYSQYSWEEIRNIVSQRPFIEMIYPEDREIVLENCFKETSGDNAPTLCEFRWLDKDGSVKRAEMHVNKLAWEGKPAVLCFITDITDRKKAEIIPEASEQRYRLLVENSMDVLWTTNMELEIDYISPSVRYLIGRSAEDIMNMYRRDTLTAETLGMSEADADRVKKGLQTLLTDPSRIQSVEFELMHPDGFTSWMEIKMSIMRDNKGQAAGILGVARDISQQKKMLQQLVSADRLTSLAEMAAGLAHEVNNPLTAIMGFTYLLQQNPDTPIEIKRDVEAIYREGKRAADVIKDFLTFARGQKPEKQAIYVNDIVNAVLRLRRNQMETENIEVSLNLGEDLPAIQGDVSQLQQVFLNIVLNAEHFMYKAHSRGQLAIATQLDDGSVKVTITDDGPGIPFDKLGRVFDPFYTTKSVGEGTGLGLSICHGIVQEHGGSIRVESPAGKGAVFTVELPTGNSAIVDRN